MNKLRRLCLLTSDAGDAIVKYPFEPPRAAALSSRPPHRSGAHHENDTSAVLLAASLLTGCATQAGYAQKVYGWQGRDVNEMLAQWGAPTSQLTMPNGNQLYTYRSAYSQEMPYQGGYYNYPWGFSGGGSVYYRCTTNFVADPKTHTILSVSFEGNDCVAPPRIKSLFTICCASRSVRRVPLRNAHIPCVHSAFSAATPCLALAREIVNRLQASLPPKRACANAGSCRFSARPPLGAPACRPAGGAPSRASYPDRCRPPAPRSGSAPWRSAGRR